MNDSKPDRPEAANNGHTEVRNTVDRCVKQVIRADEALEVLEDRIGPILAHQPDAKDGAVPEEAAECEVALALSHLCSRVQDLAAHIESITGRVRV